MADTLQRTARSIATSTSHRSSRYRLPPAGMVSILHRVSGALMFLLMPFIIWMFDTSLTSEISFEQLHQRLQRRRRLPARLVLSSWSRWR